MEIFKNIDKRVVIFWSAFYLTTLICLGLSVGALRYAYLYLNVPVILWVLVYILVAAYLVFAVWFIRSKRGLPRFLLHIALLQLIPLVASILTFVYVPQNTPYDEPYSPITGSARKYERAFNDMQDKQKAAALANGLPPFKSRAVIEERYRELRRKKKLVLIESNSKYVVKSLTYSSPYVVPKVEKLLEDLADSFQKKTQSKARFIVTSVLRTEEDLKKLRRVNGNASPNSCHCNATTIDISYVRFEEDKVRPRGTYELRLALAEALHELRKAGRCYVKIERKQYCYHITVR